MAFKLPRLPAVQASWSNLQVWWDKLCTKIEAQEGAQDDIIATLNATVATLNATVSRLKRITSHTSPTTIVHATDTGTTSNIVIDNHTRVYGDGTTLSITGATITGAPADTIVALYYDDTTLAVAAPTFHYTTTYPTAQAVAADGRHFMGFIKTPVAGSAATKDGGGVYPLGSNVGGELD